MPKPFNAGAWVFNGDTASNPALRRRLQALQVASLMVETAFRDDDHALAACTRRLHPAPWWGSSYSN